MTIKTTLNQAYEVRSIGELAETFEKVSTADGIVDQMKGDAFKDLVGRTCYEFSNDTTAVNEDTFKAWAARTEEVFKDTLEMVYIENEHGVKQARFKGEIGGIKVKPTQRKLNMNGKEYQIVHTPMPGAYRSAKSVIQNAIANDVQLLDGDGFPKAKAVIEKEIKDKKAPKTELEKFVTALEMANKLADNLNATEAATAMSLVQLLENKLAATVQGV